MILNILRVMARKEYLVYLDESKEVEKIIRMFLFRNSDTVRLTRQDWGYDTQTCKHIKGGTPDPEYPDTVIFGDNNDPKFIKTLKNLKPNLIKKIVNRRRYDCETEDRDFEVEHLYFKLSKKLKDLISEETLIWNCEYSKHFYGFEDPNFYKDDVKIAKVTTHHGNVMLYLMDAEKKELEKEGLKLSVWKETFPTMN